jgi:thiol-disulfide isomerase/thioredoxin
MMTLQSLPTYRDLQDRIRDEQAVLFYFSYPSCGVCKSLKPKVATLVEENFPKLGMYYVDIELVPEAAGQLSVFSVPAVLVFFQGKELIREARNFGIQELGGKIDRYYSMLFGEGD